MFLAPHPLRAAPFFFSLLFVQIGPVKTRGVKVMSSVNVKFLPD